MLVGEFEQGTSPGAEMKPNQDQNDGSVGSPKFAAAILSRFDPWLPSPKLAGCRLSVCCVA